MRKIDQARARLRRIRGQRRGLESKSGDDDESESGEDDESENELLCGCCVLVTGYVSYSLGFCARNET